MRGDVRLRQPILVVLGHVDVGKTLLLDKIRGTAVQYREAGGITQHIGASLLPREVIEHMIAPLSRMFRIKIRIPGLLIIDTPGHEAFANLRRRGGSVADMAILVIDVMKGFEKQTYESIEILKARKTPFVVALNKIDRIPGWKPMNTTSFLESFAKQSPEVRNYLETMLYKVVGEFAKLGFRAERIDRVRDFTRTVAIIPTSAVTGEGIAELLAAVSGLAQAYMTSQLAYTSGPAKGVVLEVKEEPGLGTTIDVIIFDGILRKTDLIVVGGLEKPVITRIRALLMPKPLDEMRSPEDKFLHVEEVVAATGVKIAAPDLEGAVAGAPMMAVWDERDVEKVVKSIMEEVAAIRVKTDKEGVIVKADALGSLEALVSYLRSFEIPVRLADVGPVSRRDVIEASVSRSLNKYYGCILAFNVKVLEDARIEASSRGIKVFVSNIIYRLVEEYQEWVEELRRREEMAELSKLILPGMIRILPGFVFRRSNPAIVGVEVLAGRIRPGYPLMKEDGTVIGQIKQIQESGNPLDEARKGAEVAISIRGRAFVGRNIREGDVLYVKVPEDHVNRLLSRYGHLLSGDEKELLYMLKRRYLGLE